ncbi:MAG: TIR domain-containing protein [Lachnospiraceae bacterium]
MAKKKVFVSFDYDNDKHYYYLLSAWDANPDFDFVFSDYTSKEIQSNDVDVVKRALSRKIGEATYTLVIIGADANKKHADSKAIGYKNWQNYEVAKSVERKNKLVGIKINTLYSAPEEMLGVGTKWASSFTKDKIIAALNEA